jgi:hypothetical protein
VNRARCPANLPLEKLQVSFDFCGRGRADSSARIIPDEPQPGYGKTYNYLLLLVSDDVLLGEAPLDVDESEADGVALLPLEEPVVSEVEVVESVLEVAPLVLGAELEPVLLDELSLLFSVFVASSRRQSSFAEPVMLSQRGELPYALGEDLSVDEELELCAKAAMGKASAIAITANFVFMRSPWVEVRPAAATAMPASSTQGPAVH